MTWSRSTGSCKEPNEAARACTRVDKDKEPG